MPSALSIIGFVAILGAGATGMAWADRLSIYDDFTWPAPVRWVLPNELKHFHFATPIGERDHALQLADAAGKQEASCAAAWAKQGQADAALAENGRLAVSRLREDLRTAQLRDSALHTSLAAAQAYKPPVGADECHQYQDLEQFVHQQLLGLP